MKKEVESGEVAKNNIAFLTDRILVNKGMEQIYGTQFYEDKDGKFLPKIIKNMRELDKRRREMELENFEAYKNRLKNKKQHGTF